MKDEVFSKILHSIKLPLGVLLSDGTTYRITSDNFKDIHADLVEELNNLEKFLVLTNGQGTVVGGILFYGNIDLQAIIFPEYRGMHYMSTIHKNGILKSECYPNQCATIAEKAIESFDDFLMKHYLASCAGLYITNLDEIHKYFNMFKPCDKYRGFQQLSEEEFVRRYS